MKKPIQTQEIPANLSEIAKIIERDWTKIYFGAVPYLQAMKMVQSIEDNYFCDSATSIVRYFLSNATTWRGETARATKAKLNEMLNSKK